MFPERTFFHASGLLTKMAVAAASNVVAIGTLGVHSIWKLKGVAQAAVSSLQANKLGALKKAAACVVDVIEHQRHFYYGTPTCAIERRAVFGRTQKIHPLYADEYNSVLKGIIGKIGQADVHAQQAIAALRDLDLTFSTASVLVLLATSLSDGYIEAVGPMLHFGTIESEFLKCGAAGLLMAATGTFTPAVVGSYVIKRVVERLLTPSEVPA